MLINFIYIFGTWFESSPILNLYLQAYQGNGSSFLLSEMNTVRDEWADFYANLILDGQGDDPTDDDEAD